MITRTEAMQRWLKALKSNQFAQGRERLHKGDHYCCLGVACHVLAADLAIDAKTAHIIEENLPVDDVDYNLWYYDGESTELPQVIQELFNFDEVGSFFLHKLPEKHQEMIQFRGEPDEMNLAELNDSGKWTFEEIADLIEAIEACNAWVPEYREGF